MAGQACSTRSPAVTRLTVYRRLQVLLYEAMNLLYESLIFWVPGLARISPGLEDAFMGPKVLVSQKNLELLIMHEISKILSSADLRIRDVECHQAFRKPSLAYEL